MKKIIGTVPFVNSYPLTFYINDIDSNINLKVGIIRDEGSNGSDEMAAVLRH